MDRNDDKKIILSNQRRFTFSSRYEENRLNELSVEARVLYKTVIDLPILPQLATRLEDELIIRSIFGTAAIEGNPLNEEQVAEVISNSGQRTKQRAAKEILNLKNTYAFIDKLVNEPENTILTEENILSIHRLITSGIDYDGNSPGEYRSHQVKVGDASHGGIYTPPSIKKDIAQLMKTFVEWVNSEFILQLNPIIRAALAHYHFSIIHPFGDGNGRTARAIEAYLLWVANIKYVPLMLSNYYYKNIDEYYAVFSQTLKNSSNDITDFLEFVMKGFVESLHDIKEKITYFIRRFALRDYYQHLSLTKKINKRQLNFLNLLLDQYSEFTLKELPIKTPFSIIFQKMSERTLRRDIQTLLELELVILTEDKSKYVLNYKVLG